jgi:hypothetical protein
LGVLDSVGAGFVKPLVDEAMPLIVIVNDGGLLFTV